MTRKFLLALVFSTIPNAAIAWEYVLNFQQECGYESGGFLCKKISGTAPLKQSEDGTFVTAGWDAPQYPMRVLKDDENVLVLEYDTLFSGTRILYIMKKTLVFHWTEIAYTDHLGEEVHYKRGTVSLKGK